MGYWKHENLQRREGKRHILPFLELPLSGLVHNAINYTPHIIFQQAIWIFPAIYHQGISSDQGNLFWVAMDDYETDSYFKFDYLFSALHREKRKS